MNDGPTTSDRKASVPRPAPIITMAFATGAPASSTTTPDTLNAATETSGMVISLTVCADSTANGWAAETSVVPGKYVAAIVVADDGCVAAPPNFDVVATIRYSPGDSPKIRNS